MYSSPQRRIAVSVHGDDFTACGPADSLDWYEKAVSAEYEISVGPRLGPAPEDEKQARVLNRVITWFDDRIEYEADPRQAERLIDELGLTGASAVVTPGVKLAYQEYTRDAPLGPEMVTPFRGTVAERISFLRTASTCSSRPRKSAEQCPHRPTWAGKQRSASGATWLANPDWCTSIANKNSTR